MPVINLGIFKIDSYYSKELILHNLQFIVVANTSVAPNRTTVAYTIRLTIDSYNNNYYVNLVYISIY